MRFEWAVAVIVTLVGGLTAFAAGCSRPRRGIAAIVIAGALLALLFVVLGLTVTVSVLDIFNIRPSARALLLPMVSLTMMIEAFQRRFEENGHRSALRKLGITLLVAFCCWLLFSIEEIQWTFLTFPESEFFVAAALVLVGSCKETKATIAALSPIAEESRVKGSPPEAAG